MDMDSMIIQRGDRILGVTSYGWLTRIFTDGRVDGSFSGWGHQQLWDMAAHTNFGEVLFLDGDRFLVVGSRLPAGKTGLNQEAIVLEWYNSDGTLNTHYGKGSGRTFIDSDPERIRYFPNGQRDASFHGDGMFLQSRLAAAGTRYR